jgi:hypothetical protein
VPPFDRDGTTCTNGHETKPRQFSRDGIRRRGLLMLVDPHMDDARAASWIERETGCGRHRTNVGSLQDARLRVQEARPKIAESVGPSARGH